LKSISKTQSVSSPQISIIFTGADEQDFNDLALASLHCRTLLPRGSGIWIRRPEGTVINRFGLFLFTLFTLYIFLPADVLADENYLNGVPLTGDLMIIHIYIS